MVRWSNCLEPKEEQRKQQEKERQKNEEEKRRKKEEAEKKKGDEELIKKIADPFEELFRQSTFFFVIFPEFQFCSQKSLQQILMFFQINF